MGLTSSWREQMHDFVTAGEQHLRDQAPMAFRPERLGAHEARDGLLEFRRERRLPELRVAPRPGEAPDVDERPHAGVLQAFD